MPNRLAVKLRPAAEKLVKQRHPWVFSESIARITPEGEAGDLAIIFDRSHNKPIAIGLYDPGSPVAIKIIHHGGPTTIDENFFRKRLEQAYGGREQLREHTNAYRMVFGENDGFPGMIVDIFDQTAIVKLYSPAWSPYVPKIAAQIAEITSVKAVVLRLSRQLQNIDFTYREGQVLAGNLEDPVVHFHEYGVRFETNVLLGHKTGFFLDHRQNRRKVGMLSLHKTVLDVFSYTGGFSVHALAGGATSVTSVDISRQALELAKRNAALNSVAGEHHTLAGDAFETLDYLVHQQQKFDIVVIDPPSFAKSIKEKYLALKKYTQLATLGAQLTESGGLLLLASCSSRIDEEEFKKAHRDAFRAAGISCSFEDLTTHDVDHPVRFKEGAYLKSAWYKVH